jgi:hypothetical protein
MKSSRIWNDKDPDSILMLDNPLQAKADPSIALTEAGTIIDSNDEQFEKARDSIR